MPLSIVRNDITTMQVDAIVNAANNSLLGGGGVDGCIHRAAGPELLAECRTLNGCPTGQAKITGGYRLPAKYVIHTVGPIWKDGTYNEERDLRSCYKESLQLAKEYKCESIAFPLISAGVYGYPKAQALKIAIEEISNFLLENEMLAYIVIFDKRSYEISGKLFSDVKQYIDDHYVEQHSDDVSERLRRMNQLRELEYDSHISEAGSICEHPAPYKTSQSPKPLGSVPSEPIASGTAASAPVPSGSASAMPASAAAMPSASKPAQVPPMASIPAPSTPATAKKPRKPSFGRKPSASTPVWPKTPSLDSMLSQIDESFSQMLLRKIDESGMKDSDCYKKANIDRKLFSKIKNDVHYKPSKATVIAFAIALELPLEEAKEMLLKAGYALSHSNKFDIIIEYFIISKNYNIYEINEVLFAFDQVLLGV